DLAAFLVCLCQPAGRQAGASARIPERRPASLMADLLERPQGKSRGRTIQRCAEEAAMESSRQTPAPSQGDGVPPGGGHDYPLTFSVDYPDRSLSRTSTAFRIFTIIPIAILAATVEGGSFGSNAGGAGARYAGGGIGILVIPVLLMLLFRKKYPRWWFDWNLQLTRFTNRVAVYFALMDDRYPS